MVKIRELQYYKYNPETRQEREIEYSSWENYIQDIQAFDGMRYMPYPSVPRITSIMNFKIWDGALSLEYDKRTTRQRVVHEAHLIEGGEL